MNGDRKRRRRVFGSLCIVVMVAVTSACSASSQLGTSSTHDAREAVDGYDLRAAVDSHDAKADVDRYVSKTAANRYGSTAAVTGLYAGSGDGPDMIAMGKWMNNITVQWAGDYAEWNGPSTWQIEQWNGIDQPHVLWSMAFLPPIAADREFNRTGWLAEVEQYMHLAASGAYDAHWLEMARRMAATSRQGKDAIRIGWELGGEWFPWGSRVFAGAGALQKQAWEHYAKAIRAGGWQVKTVWDSEDHSTLPDPSLIDVVNTGGYNGGANAWAGCSAGQHKPDGTWRFPEAVWDCSEQGMGHRLQESVELARSIDKPLAISEWGLSYGNDDTHFVQAMHDFVVSHEVMFAIYFDNDNRNVSREMHDLDHFPRGKALFRKLFSEP